MAIGPTRARPVPPRPQATSGGLGYARPPAPRPLPGAGAGQGQQANPSDFLFTGVGGGQNPFGGGAPSAGGSLADATGMGNFGYGAGGWGGGPEQFMFSALPQGTEDAFGFGAPFRTRFDAAGNPMGWARNGRAQAVQNMVQSRSPLF